MTRLEFLASRLDKPVLRQQVGVDGFAAREVVRQNAVDAGEIQGRKIEADFFRRGAILKGPYHTVERHTSSRHPNDAFGQTNQKFREWCHVIHGAHGKPAERESQPRPKNLLPVPILPSGHSFPNVQQSDYWSAATNADGPAIAWFVNFGIGDVPPTIRPSATVSGVSVVAIVMGASIEGVREARGEIHMQQQKPLRGS